MVRTKIWYICSLKLSRETVRGLARARGLTLAETLRRAGISRNAFYHLARRPTVLPRSVHALGAALGVRTSALLEEAPPAPDVRSEALLKEARRIQARNPKAAFDNIWHTLWLLEMSPAERLQRSLVRGQSGPRHR